MNKGSLWQQLEIPVVKVVQLVLVVLSRILMYPFFNLKVIGHVISFNNKQPVLIIANHKSYFDPLIISNSIRIRSIIRPLRYISKDDLFDSKLSGWFFYMIGAFPARRGQGYNVSLAKPREIIANSGTVIFFPEGRCLRQEDLGQGRVGAAILALESKNLKILPIAIRNSYKISSIPFINRPTVTVKIGEPFELTPEQRQIQDPQILTSEFMDILTKLYSETSHV